MATSYVRQSSFADGDTITAALFNEEFNRLLTAFSYASSGTTGHRHDGTAAEGGNIHTIGDQDFLNKILTTGNTWEFYVEVSSAAAKQLVLQDGALVPNADSDLDLGTSSIYFKDAYIDSITTTGNVGVGGNLTVTGTTTFNGGTITLGDAAADNVVFGADVNSSIIPNTDDTYDLGSASQQWRNVYVDGTVFADVLDLAGTAITSTAAELNILDGVTSTAAELNILDGVTSTAAELNALDGITAVVGELNALDIGATAVGTAVASKAVILDSSKDYTGIRNLTISGELDAATLDVSGAIDIAGNSVLASVDVTGLATASTFEPDGDTSAGDNAAIGYAAADGLVLTGQGSTGDVTIRNDADALVAHVPTGTNGVTFAGDVIVPDGDLILGSTAVTSTAAELNILDGKSFLDEDNLASDSATAIASQQSIKAYVDAEAGGAGTMSSFILEDDDGTEVSISDAEEVKFIGSGITTNWTDTTPGSDGDPFDLTFTVDAAQTGITSIHATDLIIGEDAQTAIDFGTANEIDFKVDNAARLTLTTGALYPVTDNQIDLGTSSLEFKDAFFDGTVTADAFAGPLTGNVTGNASGTALTVTQAAQTAITTVGTLTTLTVDTVIINGSTIGHTDDTDLITVADGIVTVAGEVSLTTLDIGGTNVTSTAAELNALDGITAVVGELNALDIGSTAVGTAVASKAIILDSNKDYTGVRNFTVSGELDAATGDFSGAVDIAGTTNLDAVDIDGAVQIDGTVTVGVDDTGLDVKFFGASAGAYLEWDESADQLRIMGASADATTSTGKLLLATSLTNINANDVIGKVDFQAPHEAGGTDAITVAASIQAHAQATFSSSVNATDLLFYTGHSEAATEKFRFTSQGELGVGGANYGTDGQVLTSAGAGAAPAWEDAGGGGGGLLRIIRFTSAASGTYSIGTDTVAILITSVAGGGGGANGGSAGVTGGGGSGGGVAQLYIASADSTYAYVVGAGGARGTSGANGAATTIAGIASGGGTGGVRTNNSGAKAGTAPTGGDVNGAGNSSATSTTAGGGVGGAGVYFGFGAGGSGGASDENGTAGGAGYIEIREYS